MLRKCILSFFLTMMLLSTASPGSITAQPGYNDELVIHRIEREPNPSDPNLFDVIIHLAVLDMEKVPKLGLLNSDFHIRENGVPIDDFEYTEIPTLPVNLIIVIDNSYKIEEELPELKNELVKFVQDLPQGSQVKVLTFSKDTRVHLDWTSDRDLAAQKVNEIEIDLTSGPCFYQAAIKAWEDSIKEFSTRNAVLFMMDGFWTEQFAIDRNTCTDNYSDFPDPRDLSNSKVQVFILNYTQNDPKDLLIAEAAQEAREEINQQHREISRSSGGRYYEADRQEELNKTFESIFKNLTEESVIKFTSGYSREEVQVELWYGDQKAERGELPANLAPRVYFDGGSTRSVSPGKQVVTIHVVHNELAQAQSMELLLDGNSVATQDLLGQASYQTEFEVDLSPYAGRTVSLRVEVFDSGRSILDADEIQFAVGSAGTAPTQAESTIPVEAATAYPTELDTRSTIFSPTGVQITPGLTQELDKPQGNSAAGYVIFIAGLLIAAGGTAGYLLWKRGIDFNFLKRSRPIKQPDTPTTSTGQPEKILYHLSILEHPDPAMLGKKLHISRSEYFVGRDISNDLPLPRDNKVSRRHVLLVAKFGSVQLVELKMTRSDHRLAGPAHGTFVDGKRIINDIRLYSGSVIGLGPSTKIAIEIMDHANE